MVELGNIFTYFFADCYLQLYYYREMVHEVHTKNF